MKKQPQPKFNPVITEQFQKDWWRKKISSANSPIKPTSNKQNHKLTDKK